MDSIIDETYLINMDKETTRLTTFDFMMTSKYVSSSAGQGDGFNNKNTQWKYVRMPAINGKDLHNGIVTTYRTKEENLTLDNCKSTIDISEKINSSDPNIINSQQITINNKYSGSIDSNQITLTYLDKLTAFKRKYINDANLLSPGEMGCLLSHVYLWEEVATNPNLNRIIIFEDDARTHMDIITIQGLILDLYEYLNTNNIEEPDMLYLGKALDICAKYQQVWNNVYRTYHPLCLHAYLITKKGAQKLLQKAPYDVPIDVVPIHAISNKLINVMTFHPSLYFQDILNNTSSLRDLSKALNITTECLVEIQHLTDGDINYIGVILIGLIITIILYTLYIFMWSGIQ
jgi:GR25 family glycosyltransferase involved in LPS biosynthesis